VQCLLPDQAGLGSPLERGQGEAEMPEDVRFVVGRAEIPAQFQRLVM
jgi:hypothetical protein